MGGGNFGRITSDEFGWLTAEIKPKNIRAGSGARAESSKACKTGAWSGRAQGRHPLEAARRGLDV